MARKMTQCNMEVLVYIYDRVNWPNFEWDQVIIADILTSVRFLQGRFIDKIESLGFSLQEEAAFQTLPHDVIKTSEIEDEHLDKQQVCHLGG
jgi:Fic family protein